jgi:ferric-dicitrate binding protein FerR (iron transport regulator)
MNQEFTTAEALLAEESFQCWYLKEDIAAIAQWENWINEDPSRRRELAEKAITLLHAIQLKEGSIDPALTEAAYNRLQQGITDRNNKNVRVISLLSRRRWIAVAAAVILLVAGAGVLKYFNVFSPSIATHYGQIMEQRLPDGSEVTLNAHSRISYSNGWEEGQDREVWLNGEAFFHVQKTPQKSRFIVHTSRFDIIVTGTQFNVVNRNGKTNILLKEGSVTLRTKTGQEVFMKPGDFVEMTDEALKKKQAENNNIIAWKDRKMVFENTAMPDAVRMIEEHYGVTVTLAGDSIATKTISGILPNDNLDVLLSALEATLEFNVKRNGNQIIINDQP